MRSASSMASEVAPNPLGDRASELDGLRGWAALSVTAYHCVYMAFADNVPDLKNIVTASLFNGELAVLIFFVLSGDALSISFWRHRGYQAIQRSAIKRYPRLTLPILASTAFTMLLVNSGWSFVALATDIMSTRFLRPEPIDGIPMTEWISYALASVYVHPLSGSFSPFLWTMKSEMIGSFLLFAILLLILKTRYTKTVLCLSFFSLFIANAMVSCFFAGALIGYARHVGFWKSIRERIGFDIGLPLLAVTLAAGGALAMSHGEVRQPMILLALIGVVSVNLSRNVSRFLQNGISQFLGRISFMMYLTHYSVLISLTCGLSVLSVEHGIASPATFLAIGVGSVCASILLAWIFMPIERGTITACDRIWSMFKVRFPSAKASHVAH